MLTKTERKDKLGIRHRRIRKRISGTSGQPRLSIHRSLNNIYAQIIDDTSQKTLVSVSTLTKDFRSKMKNFGNVKAAEALGLVLVEKAKQKGITKVCFDRGGYLYHGRVKAFAESVRKAGLIF